MSSLKPFLRTKKIPARLQPVLWTADIRHLDLERDKTYILHQVLSSGRLEDWLWLFRVYQEMEMKKVFDTFPYKNYDPARFHFVKNYLLGLKRKRLDPQNYVKNIPRNIE